MLGEDVGRAQGEAHLAPHAALASTLIVVFVAVLVDRPKRGWCLGRRDDALRAQLPDGRGPVIGYAEEEEVDDDPCGGRGGEEENGLQGSDDAAATHPSRRLGGGSELAAHGADVVRAISQEDREQPPLVVDVAGAEAVAFPVQRDGGEAFGVADVLEAQAELI